MADSSLSPREQKIALRAEMRGKRAANKERNESRFETLKNVFLRQIRLEENAVVASYSAIRDELVLDTLNDALRAQGHRIVLPVIVGKKKPLVFRIYERGDMLLANPLGIFEPTSFAPGLVPDVILIPLLAFDSMCNRLGYGGGYYDRTIKRIRAIKPVLTIGIACAYQEVPRIPTGRNDVPLDRIVTERGIL